MCSSIHKLLKNGAIRNDKFIVKMIEEKPPLVTYWLTFLSYYLLMFIGWVTQSLYVPNVAKENTNRAGYPSLYGRFESFYCRYVYRRIRDCWNRPVSGVPGSTISLHDRVSYDDGWSFTMLNSRTECLNLGSYNYLGFAESTGPCAESAIEMIRKYGLTACSPRTELGTNVLHTELERLTAQFFGVEDAITFGMGFATNALNIPTLFTKGSLVISDEKNHSSIIVGLKSSEASVKIFRHNDVIHLEELLQKAIIEGQTSKGEYIGWDRIFIIVEGVYSMEGTIVHLPEIIALKKRYKAYLYLDEAHSVGAMGNKGRGVLDYFQCNPCDVDILMGTFTKSFGSAGGYIAGSRQLISYLKLNSYAHTYAMSMSAPVAQQIIQTLKIIMGLDGSCEGKMRIDQLARNTRYFRRRLRQIGVIIYGHDESPVVPILVYFYSKVVFLVRQLTAKRIATVGVAFPATPLFQNRIRICLSAAHTKEQLDYALNLFEDYANNYGLKYSRHYVDNQIIEY